MYRRLLEWRRGGRPGPRRLHVVLTERCNLRCLSCFMAETPASAAAGELPDAVVLDLLEDAVGLGIREVYLVGGEPFVRRDLVLEAAARVKGHGLRGEMTTNGTLLRPGDARRLVEIGWDYLQVSVDGPDAETHDALRGAPGSFHRIVRSFGHLREARRGAGRRLPRLALSTVVSNRNFRRLRDVVELAATVGADEAIFQSLKPMSRHCPSLALDDGQRAELRGAAAEAVEAAARLGVRTNARDLTEARVAGGSERLHAVMAQDVHGTGDPLLGAHCYVPWYNAVVHWDGRVDPCWEWDGEPMGDARSQSLSEIWHGPRFEAYRAAFVAREIPSHCARCCLGHLDHTRWLRLKALRAAGEWEELLRVADGLLAHQPDHPQAVEARLDALYHLGRAEEARATLRRTFVPGRAAWPEDLLMALFVPHREGDAEAVVGAADRVLAGSPDAAYAWWVRGAALQGAGRLDEARESLERAASGRCDSFRDAVLDSLAQLALAEGRPRDAARLAEAALALAPGKDQTRRLRSRALRALREGRRGGP